MYLKEPISSLRQILKELMHVLRFQNEHNRPDRDNYIIVNFENIPVEFHD